MESTVLENFLVEVQGMKKNDARLKVIADLEAIKEEYKEYQDAGKYGLYTLDVSDDEMIRREIIRKKNIRESNGEFGMKNYLPESRERMTVASDAELFPILETVVYN
jgi:hypothetical protein|tara:strand:- start:400 stop:720 length:321 start_codon:yes stop_codon:yes gene_type:complete